MDKKNLAHDRYSGPKSDWKNILVGLQNTDHLDGRSLSVNVSYLWGGYEMDREREI